MSDTNKRTERALRIADFTIERAADAIFWVDSKACIHRVNEAACRIHGYTRDELLSMTVHDITPDYQKDIWPEFWTKVKKQKAFIVESRHRAKDGRIFPVEVSINYIEFEGEDFICSIARDITERKLAQAEIARLAKFPDENPNPVLRISRDGAILYHNKASAPLLKAWRCEGGEALSDYWRQLVLDTFDSESPRQADFECCDQIFSLTFAPIVDSNYVNVYALDITERKRAEKRLRQVFADLRRSHDELKATQLQLIQAEKMESIGRLAAGVAHEVKNPLAVTLMGIEYLSNNARTDDENVPVILRDMRNAIYRADSIVRGLVNFSASSQLDVKEEDLNAVLEQSLLLVNHELTRGRINLIKNLGKRLPPVRVDRTKIGQVFVNLFMNAIQAMPGGGTLAVKTYTKSMTAKDRKPADQIGATVHSTDDTTLVVAEVEDTGTGVPEEVLLKVFDPFFTTKPTGVGTGLGLAVVRNIIELHGGTIDMTNRQEGGVRVTIMFNVQRKDEI